MDQNPNLAKGQDLSPKGDPDQEHSGAPHPDRPERQLRGLYSRVNISVKTLNLLIVVLCALLVAVIAFGVAHRGFQVEFDTLGGTGVESQTRMYGELLDPPEEPSREGYTFTGWYQDQDGTYPWDLGTDTVTGSMTLYAGWEAQ